jgi:hypothetical protein
VKDLLQVSTNSSKVDSLRTVAAIRADVLGLWCKKTKRVETIGGTRSGSYIWTNQLGRTRGGWDIRYRQLRSFVSLGVMWAMVPAESVYPHPSNLN